MTDGIGTVDVRVRYAETDQMGRAHHRHVLVWCELGRTVLLRDRGVSYAELEEAGLLLPVSRVEIEYRAPVSYDDLLRIETRVDGVRSREVRFGYRLWLPADGTLVARATVTLVSTDADGRPARLPVDVRAALEELAARARSEYVDAC